MFSDHRLPVELVRNIIVFYIQPVSGHPGPSRPHSLTAPAARSIAWQQVESLTLASRLVRELALEEWFAAYVARSPSALDPHPSGALWPRLSTWTRVLYMEYSTDFQSEKAQSHTGLKHFDHAHKLVIVVDPYLETPSFAFAHVPPSVHAVEIYGMQRPAPPILRMIGNSFPLARTLALAQRWIFCGLCNTVETPCVPSSIRSLVYTDGVGLPAHFGSQLAGMEHLHTVFITVASRSQCTWVEPDEQNENLWSGECCQCMRFLYPDEAFRRAWVDKKRAPDQPQPPALKRVEWRFVGGEEYEDERSSFDDDEDDVVENVF